VNVNRQYGGQSQFADNITNWFGEQRNHLEAGRRHLYDRLYPEACRSLRTFLEAVRMAAPGDLPGTAERDRAEAHLLFGIAMLREALPSARSPREIEKIGRHLQAAAICPLAAVLATLVRDDFYVSDELLIPDRLKTLAARAEPADLSAEDWSLLSKHVAPIAGPTWARLREHRRDLPVFASKTVPRQANPDRAPAVRRYFTPTPEAPSPVSATPGHVLLGTAVLLLLGTWMWFAGARDKLDAFGWSAVLTCAAAGLLAASVAAYRERAGYLRKQAEYDQEYARAEPKPADAYLDRLLSADVAWICGKGARLHRLNLRDENGRDLLVPPQVVVGISEQSQTQTRIRMVPRSDGYSGFTPVAAEEDVLTARVREGADGRLRADSYHVVALYLTQTRVCVYHCELDFATGRITSDAAKAFRYDDVVEVSSRTNRTPAEKSLKLFFQPRSAPAYVETRVDDRFELSIVNGNSIGMSIGFSDHAKLGRGRSIAWGNHKVRRIVERMVWSQRERQAADLD
jgi:hypothetical protein